MTTTATGAPDDEPLDRGLTDGLDPLLGDRAGGLLELIDRHAGIRIDDTGIHVRRLLPDRHVAWDEVERIQLDSRLDLVVAFVLSVLPVRRIPAVGLAVRRFADVIATQVGVRAVPGARARAGWAVATIVRRSWRRDVDLGGGATLVALVYPGVTEELLRRAAERGIPVGRDRGPDDAPAGPGDPDGAR